MRRFSRAFATFAVSFAANLALLAALQSGI